MFNTHTHKQSQSIAAPSEARDFYPQPPITMKMNNQEVILVKPADKTRCFPFSFYFPQFCHAFALQTSPHPCLMYVHSPSLKVSLKSNGRLNQS